MGDNVKSRLREYFEALVTAILIAFAIRSFIVEPFKIPSSSMEPTLLVGDHIFVNKFWYGLRPPFTKRHFFQFKTPERGEVIVFIYPQDEKKDYIKRVIGLPGDKIRIDNKEVYINNNKVPHIPISVAEDVRDKRALRVMNDTWSYKIPYVADWQDMEFVNEKLGEVEHLAQFERKYMWHSLGQFISENDDEVTVPPGMLFVMGDNRDNSSDGREWGFVPMENVKGKAMFIWLSLDNDYGGIRWKRFGTLIR